MNNTASNNISTAGAAFDGNLHKPVILFISSRIGDKCFAQLLEEHGYNVKCFWADDRCNPYEKESGRIDSVADLKNAIRQTQPDAIVTCSNILSQTDEAGVFLKNLIPAARIEHLLQKMPELEGLPVAALHFPTLRTYRNDTTGKGYGFDKAIQNLPASIDEQAAAMDRFLKYEIPRKSIGGTSFGVPQR